MNASRNLSHPDFKRRALFVALGGMMAAMSPSHAADIGQVLGDSQRKRLTEIAVPVKDAAREARVRASFERLCLACKPQVPVELLVTSGPVIAETLLGRIVVANEALADVAEGERLFVLAHELGHVMNDHWGKLAALYRVHVPGELRQEVTDAAAPALGRAASAMAHAHELEADAFAAQAITRLGFGAESAMAVFIRQGVQHDTATHPGTRKRVAQLRMLTTALQQ